MGELGEAFKDSMQKVGPLSAILPLPPITEVLASESYRIFLTELGIFFSRNFYSHWENDIVIIYNICVCSYLSHISPFI